MVASKGKLKTGPKLALGDCGTQQIGSKSFYFEDERVKESTCDSVNANTTSTRGKLMPSRMRTAPANRGVIPRNASLSKSNINVLEKTKVMHGSSVKTNTTRRALADVSNVQGPGLRHEVHDHSKSVKGKNESSASSQRVSMCSNTRSVSTSRKPSMGQVSKNLIQGVSNNHTSKKVNIKDLKVPLNDQRTKGQGRVSADTSSRKTARKPPLPSRKSLPVLKEVNQLDMSDTKENIGTSENGKGKYGFPLKSKVSRRAVSQLSNARSHLWRNRVSDGFIVMPSGDQMNVDAHVSSRRKSTRPTMRTALTTSNARSNSRITCAASFNRSTSVAAISSKKKKEVIESSLPKNCEAAVSHKPSQEAFQSDGNSASKDSANMISLEKAKRRRSYTSSLMARSKLLEEHSEKLPSIDDKCNQLEVSEYVDDIYQYYWVTEAQYPSLADYMIVQTDITPQIRGILINWLIEVHFKFDLMQETLYLTVSLLDQYLSVVTIKKYEMQLVGLTSLLLASKYEDFWHPRIKDLISISAESYTRDEMLGMEKLILKKLKFRLNVPTSYVFMLRFLKAAQSDTKLEHLAFYLIELCLVEYEALKFKPSMLCASAIYVARCTLLLSPAWTPLLGKHGRYEESQLRDCAEMILRFQEAARTSQLNVTYEKYMSPEHSCVAAIKPLDKLPF